MKIRNVMTTDVITLTPEQTLKDAAETFRDNGISGAPVLDDGELVGILSEGDVVESLKTRDIGYELWFPAPFEFVEIPIRNLVHWRSVRDELQEVGDMYVRDAMTRTVKTIALDDTVEEASEKMAKHRINRLPVLQDGELVGIVTREDIIRGLIG